MPQLFPGFEIPKIQLEPLLPQIELAQPLPILPPAPAPAPAPTPPQIPALVPYPVATPYPTYTTTPTSVQPRPLAEVQRAAIDPTLLLLGGIAVLALLVAVMRK